LKLEIASSRTLIERSAVVSCDGPEQVRVVCCRLACSIPSTIPGNSMPSKVTSNWTAQVNFGQRASGYGSKTVSLAQYYCPYFTSGLQRHPNTLMDLLTNKQKWVRFSPPLSALSDSEKNLTSVQCANGPHDFGIKGLLELQFLVHFRDHRYPRTRFLLTSQATKMLKAEEKKRKIG
jgi:hypothetical protein